MGETKSSLDAKAENFLNELKLGLDTAEEYGYDFLSNRYVLLKLIASEENGGVYLSIDIKTNEKVSMKSKHLWKLSHKKSLLFWWELKLLKHLQHENILTLKDITIPHDCACVYLVYELMDTNLRWIMDAVRPEQLSHDHYRFILFQILRGLHYLHSSNIVHGNLSPRSLLMNLNCSLKICDFGVFRTTNGRYQILDDDDLDLSYCAPEIILHSDNLDASIDIWSVGCIFVQFFCRHPFDLCYQERIDKEVESLPFQAIVDFWGPIEYSDLYFLDDKRKRKKILDGYPVRCVPLRQALPNKIDDPLALDLLQRMLVFNPSKRISVTEALQHPYLNYDQNLETAAAQIPDHLAVDDKSGVLHSQELHDLILGEIVSFHAHEETMSTDDCKLPTQVSRPHFTTLNRRRPQLTR